MFCEKCGNKLKEDFEFCDKCGAKVEKKEHKKHHEEKEPEEKKPKIKEEKIKEEKVEKPVPPEPPKPPRPPKKSGKGKTIFLVILDLLLVGAAVTFLILWLTKSNDCDCKCDKCESTVVDEPKKEKSKYVGKWEQNVEYKSGSKVTKRTYGLIELKEDGTFEAVFYDKDNISKTKEETKGKYTVKGTEITFSYKDEDGDNQTLDMVIKNDKICLDDDCKDYLVKNGNNKIVIYDDDDDNVKEIKKIKFTEYENLQKNYKDAIVVVIRDGCSWCEKFESVVEEIVDHYDTPVYYYESDGKISVNGTPTTIVIKNGYIVKTVEGYKEYSAMEDILDELGVK